MLASYLLESSIHGLRYVADARNPGARVAWLACVTTCVVAAAVIIYFNVANWENSPTVVTTVLPELVEGKKFMPMITVCPYHANLNNLLLELVRDDPDRVKEDHVAEVADILSYVHVVKAHDDRNVRPYDYKSYVPMFEPCSNGSFAGSDSAGCRLVRLLDDIAEQLVGKDFDFKAVKEYAARASSPNSSSPPTLDGLRRFVEEYYPHT